MSRIIALPLVLALFTSSTSPSGAIAWEHSFDAATARAREESRVLMVAVHLVGEVASERMIAKVYTDARIVELCAQTVDLATSNAYLVDRADFLEHFGSPTMAEARAIDVAVRERVLRPDAEGYVIAPQHVFLAPGGDVLLSVPYEITAAELDWCLVEAMRHADPASKLPHSSRARAPRRLIEGGVFDPAGAPPPLVAPTGKELDALIEQVLDTKLELALRATAVKAVALSGEKRAVRAVAKVVEELGERRANADFGIETLLRTIGEVSPPDYYDIVASQLGAASTAVRDEAAVALEQLGAAAAEAVLVKSIGRESEPRVRKDLARALGSCGYESAKARRELVRVATKDDDGLVRINAVLAMGRLTPHDDVREHLALAAASGNDRTRAAALIAMVWSRDPYWRDVLPALIKGESIDAARAAPLDEREVAALAAALVNREARTEAALAAAQAVLGGGDLAALEPVVRDIGGDTIPRRRLFNLPLGGQ